MDPDRWDDIWTYYVPVGLLGLGYVFMLIWLH